MLQKEGRALGGGDEQIQGFTSVESSDKRAPYACIRGPMESCGCPAKARAQPLLFHAYAPVVLSPVAEIPAAPAAAAVAAPPPETKVEAAAVDEKVRVEVTVVEGAWRRVRRRRRAPKELTPVQAAPAPDCTPAFHAEEIVELELN